MAIDNLSRMLDLADAIDRREGEQAYFRYHRVMWQLSQRFAVPLDRVVAAFVSLSPNSDYYGNLRSTVSVLDAILQGVPVQSVTVSTYNHCRDRAHLYATGARDFLKETKGPKIKNFYHNILDPTDTRWVTIDGHMSAIWQDKNLTMREALIGLREYREIAAAVKALAFSHQMLPHQIQAILWFARKRINEVKYDPQHDLFGEPEDVWKTSVDVSTMQPYRRRDEKEQEKNQQIEEGCQSGSDRSEVQETFAQREGWPSHPRPKKDIVARSGRVT